MLKLDIQTISDFCIPVIVHYTDFITREVYEVFGHITPQGTRLLIENRTDSFSIDIQNLQYIDVFRDLLEDATSLDLYSFFELLEYNR